MKTKILALMYSDPPMQSTMNALYIIIVIIRDLQELYGFPHLNRQWYNYISFTSNTDHYLCKCVGTN